MTTANIIIGESEINAQLKIKSTGIQYNQKYGLSNDSKEDVEKYYKRHWDYINDVHILNHDIVNDKDNIETIENIDIKTSGYLSKAGDRLLFAPNMLNRNEYVPKRDKERNRDIVINRGYLDEDEFIIEIPNGYEIESSLKPVKLKNDFGEFEVNVEQLSESTLHFKRRLLMKPGKFSKTSYNDYRDFRKTISRVDASKIVLIKI